MATHYYLGFDRDNKNIKITLDEKYSGDKSNILDLVKFTTRFDNQDELITFLFNHDAITDNEGITELFYTQTDSVKKIKENSEVLYYEDAKYLDEDYMRNMLIDNSNDIEFCSHIFAYQVRRSKIFKEIVDTLIIKDGILLPSKEQENYLLALHGKSKINDKAKYLIYNYFEYIRNCNQTNQIPINGNTLYKNVIDALLSDDYNLSIIAHRNFYRLAKIAFNGNIQTELINAYTLFDTKRFIDSPNCKLSYLEKKNQLVTSSCIYLNSVLSNTGKSPKVVYDFACMLRKLDNKTYINDDPKILKRNS